MKTNANVSRRTFLRTSAVASAGFIMNVDEIHAQAATTSKKPNILFVFSDQQRYGTLGCEGNKIIQTPNFDRLASRGLVFDNAFANHPLCSPYRANLITGKYGFANGVADNEFLLWDNQVTVAHALKKGGYRTGYVGKWHLGCGPYTEDKRHGFDYMFAFNCLNRHYGATYHENEEGPIKIDKYAPEGETDQAIKFMEQHLKNNSGSPFALFMSWEPPHWPYDQYPKEFDIYDPAKIDLPPNVPEQMADYARKEIAQYYGNVASLDAQMGRLMDALDRLGIADDTIVCYSSDHGDHLSSHGYVKPGDRWMHHSMRASKSTPFNESCHIPFIVRYPRAIRGARRMRSMIGCVDFMPTLLGLCGQEIPAGVQGHNLAHVAVGKDGPAIPDSVYLMNMGTGWPSRKRWVGFWRGIRTDQYIYARWLDSNDARSPMLFNCTDDSYEMNNLAGNKDHANVQKDMEERLQQWIKDTHDPFETGKREAPYNMLAMNFKLQKSWQGREPYE